MGIRRGLAFAALGLFATVFVTCGGEVFPTNSVWRFRPGGSEASSPSSAWRLPGFNDAAFADSSAPFWYGDIRVGGTFLSNMQDRYSCIFLRMPFVLTNAQEIGVLRLSAFVDDGFVAWINGREVARTNVSATAPTYQTTAANATEPVPFVTYPLPTPSNYLTTGTNVLAVQVFNTSLGSSDLGFDASLTAILSETSPPTIEGISPAPGVVTALTSISVTFSEPVNGVHIDDFLMNGVSPTAMTVSNTTYTFTFAQPLFGTIFITWATSHGITDQALLPNAFNATGPGATWQYVLADLTPPALSDLFPPADSPVRVLSQIEVTFSEAVLGVDASDLLINGQPATAVSQQPGGPFIFRFPQPQSTGTVSVAWAAGHGITDAAAVPNPFAGGNWSYTLDTNLPFANLVITEILAANVSTNGLKDEDGDSQDWIEIRNFGTSPVNLANWSLSDDPDLPGLWTFPARTLGANQFLVVFASGKDRRSTNAASQLHTNFKLSNSGEHLGLYSPESPRALVSGFTPFPEQRNDISYGLDYTNGFRYFATPTPGAANGLSMVTGVCAAVHVNVPRGIFAIPFDLVPSSETPGAELRYTTDGSEPTALSTLFPAKLRISSTTLFRAAAFKAGLLPSRTTTHSYLFNVPVAIRSLPILSIVTASNHLYGPSGILGINGGNYNSGAWSPNTSSDYHNPSQHGLAWERATSVEWIEPGDQSGFQTDCGIRVQGSDWQRPRLTPTSKFSFRLYFRSDYGPGRLEYPLFPLTSIHRFDQLVLRAGFNEQGNPFIRDEIHRRLSSDMGQIAAHGNLAVVFVNGAYYAGSPWYNPTERVHEEFFQEHLGGSPDWDVVSMAWAQGAGAPGVVDGDRADFQSLVNYVNNSTATSSLVYSNIARRLDLTNFADYCILNAYAATGDWPANNWRAGRDRANSVWRFVVWDAEWGMGIYGRSVTINSFTQTGGGPNDSGLGSVSSSEIAQLYNRLRASSDFRLLWADRVHKHFFNGGALMPGAISNRFNELRAELASLIPNMDVAILNWARDRQSIFFGQMQPYGLLQSSNAPVFNQFGGRVPAGFNLVMANLAGPILYTTDGSDPRTAFTGAISPSARTNTGPLALNASVTIRARSLQGATWSAMTEATFTVGSLGIPLRITEIMYRPPGGSFHEFLELENTGGTTADLSGMYFDGIGFQFSEGTKLAGGARCVLGSNTDTNAWKAQYPGVNPLGWFAGNLSNGGERLTLFDRFGNIITTVDYRSSGGWPTAANGGGLSLEIINPNGDPDDPANWQASGAVSGSPGAPNSTPAAPAVYLNEIMAENLGAVNNGGAFPDWIELYNPSTGAINLTGWSLTDDGDARKFVFPSTTIPALGYMTVWCDATTNTTPGLHTGFGLDRDGDRVFLYDAATNRVDALSFGLQVADYSIGRVGGVWTLTLPTTNTANLPAPLDAATNLALNEWLANPVAGQPDWIELFNKSTAAAVPLQGIYLATSNSLHQLTSLAFLAPSGYLQLFADEESGLDHLSFKLPAGGDAITLSDGTGGLIQKVVYAKQTENVSQGRIPDGGTTIRTFPGSGSPGTTNYVSTYSGPVLNEVLARNQSVDVGGLNVDFVELYNPNASSFDLGGMSLSVNTPIADQWVFPPGTILAGYAYLVVRCDSSQSASNSAGAFSTGESLDGESGGVYLFNPAGQLVNSVEYGPQVGDLSIGLSGGQWQLLDAPTPGGANAAAAVLGSNAALRVNEWMAAPLEGDDWFELFNTTNRPVDLSTISLSDDPSLVGQGLFRPAPLSFIAGNGFVKWVADGDNERGRDHVSFSLDHQGDTALIYRVNGLSYSLVDAVGFGAQTTGVSEGRLPDGNATLERFAGSATPGESNYRRLQTVVINEVLAHTDPPLEDAIEFHNPTASPLNIGGWFLSNSKVERRKHQIPAGTTIPANGYKVIYENQFNNGTTNAFTLNSAHGDQVWLSATVAGVESGDRIGSEFGASFNGASFGRVQTSIDFDFAPLTQRSFGVDDPPSLALFRTGTGLPNATPVVGPVVISEILYRPANGEPGGGEYVELQNNSEAGVALFDAAHPTNHWKLGGGVEYTFPAGVSLTAGTCLLVVDFDPANATALAEFKARYTINPTVAIYGPFSGKLANEGDSVELYRPDKPQQPPSPDAGFVPYVLADRVSYTAGSPWPVIDEQAGGMALQRLLPTLYGNDPLNWSAAAPTPGCANGLVAPDSDRDGIPDAVEFQWGLALDSPADGAEDADGDGATNSEEYRAGTDYRNAGDFLRLDHIRSGSNTVMTFRAAANHSYSVLYSDSLTNPVWRKLANVLAAPVSRTESVPDDQGALGTRFYRLVTPAW